VHELSIAQAMVAIADRHAAGRRVLSVDVKVGHLRQVVPSALGFAFELVAEGTAVEGAELRIEEVPAAGICSSCGAESALPGFPMTCAQCGGMDLEVIRGEELLVDSLEIEETLSGANLANGGGYGGS
jgi:hydrogenase nickel incorporation protein HypA/HybF